MMIILRFRSWIAGPGLLLEAPFHSGAFGQVRRLVQEDRTVHDG